MCRDTSDPESAWSGVGEGGGLGVVVAVDCRSTRMRIAESCSWREAICLESVMMTERYITCRAALAAQVCLDEGENHGTSSWPEIQPRGISARPRGYCWFRKLKLQFNQLLVLHSRPKENTPGVCFERLPTQKKLGARTKMKLVSSRGRTIDCFLSIVTVLGGGASNDVKTPLLSEGSLLGSFLHLLV